MNYLVLVSVVRAMDRALSSASLLDLVEEDRHRFRIRAENSESRLAYVISLEPERPWLGRPVGAWPGKNRTPGPFCASARKQLRGARVESVQLAKRDRRVTFHLRGGAALVAELVPHRTNLILLDAGGAVQALARRPRSSKDRLAPGQPYRPSDPVAAQLDPLSATEAEIDGRIRLEPSEEAATSERLRRVVFGVSRDDARRIERQALSSGSTAGRILRSGLERVEDGSDAPLLEAVPDVRERAGDFRLNKDSCRLHPWTPPGAPAASFEYHRFQDAAETAGIYYDGLERSAHRIRRGEQLQALLRREIRRIRDALAAVQRDTDGFSDPQRHRVWGEALLAGLRNAERDGPRIRVPDPYDSDGPWLSVPAPAGRSAQQVADDQFRRYKRALRGASRAKQRSESLERRKDELEQIHERFGTLRDPDDIETLERLLVASGLPIGLEPVSRSKQNATILGQPRLEGVRVFVSSDGQSILVGKSGPDNHRLTFQLARAEDFWLHALGVPGAHVVLRNPDRSRRPPDVALREAAQLAAWYSDARRQTYVDVQWTLRKYVRRMRRAAPGTVSLKRFETVRVQPSRLPERREALDESSGSSGP